MRKEGNKMSKIITIDRNIAIVVADEKALLVREILKHFSNDWKTKNDTKEKLAPFVESFLTRMNIECEVIDIATAENVDILSEKSEPKKASKEVSEDDI